MRFLLSVSVILLGLLTAARGQIKVDLTCEQEQYLSGEAVRVVVRTVNASGKTLVLGKDTEWLQFNIERSGGGIVNKYMDVPVNGEFSLDNSQVATKRLDLAPCFDISTPGRYRLSATVKIKEWDQSFSSPVKAFDVINGVRLWQQDFGLPQANEVTTMPEVRKYALVRANFLKQIRLYVRITDLLDNRIFRVFPIGQMVSFSKPDAQIDKDCRLHILNQVSGQSFMYCIVDPDGNLLTRHFYEFSPERPVLRVNSHSKVGVEGGRRHVSPQDLPVAPEDAPIIDESVTPIDPSLTNTPSITLTNTSEMQISNKVSIAVTNSVPKVPAVPATRALPNKAHRE